MTRTPFAPLLVLALALVAAPAAAQVRTAEVRTWDGQTLQLTEPTLEVFYTIAPPPKDGSALPESEKRQTASSGRAVGVMASLDALKPLVDQKVPVAIQHHRSSETLTIVKNSVEVFVPIERLVSVTFFRHPATTSLPPYVAPEVRRHTAVAVLADGSRVEGDVNLGWTYVRGTSPAGRIDVPWDQVEVIRFR